MGNAISNCQGACGGSEDPESKGKSGVQEVVEEVETLQEQAEAAEGAVVTLSVKPSSKEGSSFKASGKGSGFFGSRKASSVQGSDKAPSEPGESEENPSEYAESENPVEVRLEALVPSIDEEESGSVKSLTSLKSARSVSFQNVAEESGNFLIDIYVFIFDMCFSAMLAVISTGAALLHMLTRGESPLLKQWPEFLPISRIQTMKFAGEPVVDALEEDIPTE